MEIKIIRRRTNARIQRIERLVDPGLRAYAIDSDGEVRVDPQVREQLKGLGYIQ